MGFEPQRRGESSFKVRRLNHSATDVPLSISSRIGTMYVVTERLNQRGGRVDRAFAPHETKGIKIGTGFLAKRSALRGSNQDWLARRRDNVTWWCIHV